MSLRVLEKERERKESARKWENKTKEGTCERANRDDAVALPPPREI